MTNSEKYLIDANSIITPYNTFYQFEFAPSFWEQLKNNFSNNIYIIDKVKNEILKPSNKDYLSEFINNISIQNIIKPDNQADIINKYSEILNFIASSPLYSDKALKNWSDEKVADPWLIATASVRGYTIITFEVSAGNINPKNPSKNAKIIDIAKVFGVKCENLYYMMKNLKFQL